MSGHPQANGNGVPAKDPPKASHVSIPSEATKILTSLINNKSLNIPTAVTQHASTVTFTPDVQPFLPTPLKMSESASALWACVGLFANAICKERFSTGDPKEIKVDVYSGTLMLCSTFLFTIEGKQFAFSQVAPRAAHLDVGRARETYRNVLSSMYKTKDRKYFHLHGSLNATPTLNMLGLPPHRLDLQGNVEACKEIYRAAVAERDSLSIEVEANERWRQPGVTCLTVDEYAATPHGKLNIEDPLYIISKIQQELSPVPWPTNGNKNRPLAGVKVLDLTKVIAGPTITRVLALMGADVLRLSSNTQPEAVIFAGDCQLGKRDAEINLKTAEGKAKFDELLKDADVVVNSYRPGTFEKLGLGKNWVHEIARRRGKGIVYCRENCYGWSGEWSGRAGYQQISDAVTGAAWEQGKFLGLEEPVMPLFPNSDSQTGLAGGIAIMHALLQRSSEGGSYNVDVSLNQCNNWLLRDVGLHDKQTQTSLRDMHPNFRPVHDTEIFEMAPAVLESTKKSNGTGRGQLWDPARFTRDTIRWGQEGEQADFLDWRKIVSVESGSGKKDVVFEVEHGSCMPGSDEAKWL